jgi:hypothetical protein
MPGWLQAFVVASLLGFIGLTAAYAELTRKNRRLADFWQQQAMSNAGEVAKMRTRLAALDRGRDLDGGDAQ